MRGLRPLLAVVALAASILLVGARPAAACSCATGDSAQHLEWSEAVVVGVVRTVEPRPGPSTTTSPDGAIAIGGGGVVWTVEVERVYKGDVEAVERVVTSENGSSCGADPPGPGRALLHLSDRRKYDGLVRGGTERWETSLCAGNRLVEPEGVPASYGTGAPPSPGTTTTSSSVAPTTTTSSVASTSTTPGDGGSDVTIAGAPPGAADGDSGLRGAVGVGGGLAVGGAAALLLRRRRGAQGASGSDLEPDDGTS